MAFNTDKSLVLVKVEGTSGTLDDPTTGGSVLFVTAPPIPAMVQDTSASARLSSTLGRKSGGAGTGQHQTLTLSAELQPSGTAATAPRAIGTLMRAHACALDDGEIAPDSTVTETVTVYAYVDDYLYRLHGAVVSSVTIASAEGAPATITFELTGRYNEPIIQAPPALSGFTLDADPVQLESVTIGSLTNTDICLSSFSFSTGGSAKILKCLNGAEKIKALQNGKREGTVEFDVAAWSPTQNVVSTQSVYDAWRAQDVIAWSVVFGSATNKTLTLSGRMQISGINGADGDGFLRFSSLTGNVCEVSGDDDFLLVNS